MGYGGLEGFSIRVFSHSAPDLRPFLSRECESVKSPVRVVREDITSRKQWSDIRWGLQSVRGSSPVTGLFGCVMRGHHRLSVAIQSKGQSNECMRFLKFQVLLSSYTDNNGASLL